MKTLVIHWRAGHISSGRAKALGIVLDSFPGDDLVEVHTSGGKVRLPVKVDAEARGLAKLIQGAIDPAATVLVRDSETVPL